jgi:DNA topoisomerase I
MVNPMAYELIITEKPKAAQKIAESLADGRATKKNLKKVPYYELTHNKKSIVVACAVGHLYQVAEKAEKKFQYPIFDIEWKASYKISKSSAYTKAYVDAIKSLAKGASSFTIATDYDVEGEVIGLNVLKYGCEQKDGARMKFSTLTKPDLVEAYEHKSPSINWGQANAGVMRHQLDWIYGINLSRALTASLKKAGLFKIMSSGRVQGPALKIIVDKERSIQAFKAEPFWQIELDGDVKKGPVVAWHEKDKFWKEDEAKQVMAKTAGQKAAVKDIEKREVEQAPPVPFDLTALQVEAYKCFRISPKALLEYAQNLYISGLISYPRTSSQQLPPAIGFKKILQDLSENPNYTKLCAELLAKPALNPNNGSKTDPAHPAIYPTGIVPSDMSEQEAKVYDLIVKRFMAVFGEPALRGSVKVSIDVNTEIFVAQGITTIKPGWHKFYEPYGKLKEEELPEMDKGEAVAVKEIKLLQKETQPPKRYTPASIVNDLAKRNLGTKATRANIIDTLFQRGYILGDQAIQATDLGIKTISTLEKYSPTILDEEMTREFEEEMDKISEQDKDKDAYFEHEKKVLGKVLDEFKLNEAHIGKDLAFAKIESDEKESNLGECPKCGGSLNIRRGKYGQFVACKNYPECKTTFKLPGNALVKSADKKCESCGYPMLKLIRKGKRPQEVCLNHDCPTKKVEGEPETGINEKIEKKCPKCGSELLLRKSVYGKFIGCSGYPKCRYTEKLNSGQNQGASGVAISDSSSLDQSKVSVVPPASAASAPSVAPIASVTTAAKVNPNPIKSAASATSSAPASSAAKASKAKAAAKAPAMPDMPNAAKAEKKEKAQPKKAKAAKAAK